MDGSRFRLTMTDPVRRVNHPPPSSTWGGSGPRWTERVLVSVEAPPPAGLAHDWLVLQSPTAGAQTPPHTAPACEKPANFLVSRSRTSTPSPHQPPPIQYLLT